jgi:hypothetical protein
MVRGHYWWWQQRLRSKCQYGGGLLKEEIMIVDTEITTTAKIRETGRTVRTNKPFTLAMLVIQAGVFANMKVHNIPHSGFMGLLLAMTTIVAVVIFSQEGKKVEPSRLSRLALLSIGVASFSAIVLLMYAVGVTDCLRVFFH